MNEPPEQLRDLLLLNIHTEQQLQKRGHNKHQMVQIRSCCNGEKTVTSVIHDWLNQIHENVLGISGTALQTDPKVAVVGGNLAFFRQI